MSNEKEAKTATGGVPVDAVVMCWPNLIPPPMYDNPAPGWEDPALPDIKLIWKLAREVGYAIGIHGSLKRDFDLIAVPWVDDAVDEFDFILHMKKGLKADLIGSEKKPHGRFGIVLQIKDGYFKNIDMSIMPRTIGT